MQTEISSSSGKHHLSHLGLAPDAHSTFPLPPSANSYSSFRTCHCHCPCKVLHQTDKQKKKKKHGLAHPRVGSARRDCMARRVPPSKEKKKKTWRNLGGHHLHKEGSSQRRPVAKHDAEPWTTGRMQQALTHFQKLVPSQEQDSG